MANTVLRTPFREDPKSCWLSLFTPNLRDKPRFMALAEAILRQVSDLAALARSIAPGFSFTHAAGAQLDALGVLASVPRKAGWDDETYRAVLLRKLKRYTWNGMNETAGEYLEEGDALADRGGCAVAAHSGSALPLPARELLPVPIGVRTEEFT